MKIDWAAHFDRIYCVHYIPQKRKLGRLLEELNRVGILHSGIFTMRATNSNPYDVALFQSYNFARCPNSGCINLGREMLSVMNEATVNGYGRILILENDVAFLKDPCLIQHALLNMPNRDVVQFDKFVVPGGEAHYEASKEERKIGDGGAFFDPKGDTYYSGACFALNARGIEYERFALSNALRPPDSTFARSGLSRAIAVTNVAIQVVYANTVSADLYGINSHHDGYRRGGVDYSLYNLPEGYGYGSAL